MFTCKVSVRFVSSTRSIGMPMSSSIWALRFRSCLKFSFRVECMHMSMSLMLFRVVRLPKIIASWILFSLVNDFLSFLIILSFSFWFIL